MLDVLELECPRCGTGNAPQQMHVFIEHGVAVCHACGHSDVVTKFKPKEK